MQNIQPKISIIVPVYKAEKFIDQCIESLINQTYKNIEIILVDDGSPDNCPQICDQYAKNDARIIVIHKQNGGVSSARNDGIDQASGEYLMFVDSDDWLDNSIVERLFNSIISSNADLSICSFVEVLNDSVVKAVSTNQMLTGKKEIANFVNLNYDKALVSSPWAKLYKKDRICRFKEGFSFGEDILFNIQYLEKVEKVVVIEDNLYFYRNFGNNSSLSKSYSYDCFDGFLLLYQTSIKFLITWGEIAVKDAVDVNFRLVRYSLSFIRKYTLLNNKNDSIKYIKFLCANRELNQAATCLIGKKSFVYTLLCRLIQKRRHRLLYRIAKLKLSLNH